MFNTYIIQVNRNNIDADNPDPNIKLIANDIFLHTHNGDDFDFDINICIDGYYQSKNINNVFTHIFHDVFTFEGQLFAIKDKDVRIWQMIVILFDKTIIHNQSTFFGDITIRPSKDDRISIEFFIDGRMIKNSVYSLLKSGPHYLAECDISLDVIAVYIIPQVYYKLERDGLLNDNYCRDYRNYEISLW